MLDSRYLMLVQAKIENRVSKMACQLGSAKLRRSRPVVPYWVMVRSGREKQAKQVTGQLWVADARCVNSRKILRSTWPKMSLFDEAHIFFVIHIKCS